MRGYANAAPMVVLGVVGAAGLVAFAIWLAKGSAESPGPEWHPPRIIARNVDTGGIVFGQPVPGGCLYTTTMRAAEFAPHPCPPAAE